MNIQQVKAFPALAAFKRPWRYLGALLFWGGLLVAYFVYGYQQGFGPEKSAIALVEQLRAMPMLAPILFIAAYILRPLFFFSAVLLTLSAGFLFGALPAILYTIIGANAGALLAYKIGQKLGPDWTQRTTESSFWRTYAARMQSNSFETILIMRLIFLPYDFVNYAAGLLGIRWRPFLLATALGSLPGTISFSLLGASIEGEFNGRLPAVNSSTLVASIMILIASLLLSRVLRQREKTAAFSTEGEVT